MPINVDRIDRGTKRKERNTRCAIGKVGDDGRFTSRMSKTDALKVSNIEKLL